MSFNKYLLIFVSICISSGVFAQGLNHSWLLGYNLQTDTFTSSTKARLSYTVTSMTLTPESRKMSFRATQANIGDSTGNLLIASNGCWIANSTGDTMLNGSGLNPGSFTDDWNYPYSGLPIPNGNLIIPFPGDNNKYILFHQTGNYDVSSLSTELYYSIIDMTLDNGLGAVTQKNVIAIQDTLGWGLGACKHANGRDWWIVALDDSMKYIYKILVTPNGIDTIATQSFLNMSPYSQFIGQPTFSPDGSKFAFSSTYGITPGNWYHDLRLFSFDRCTGNFSDSLLINLTDTYPGLGTAFSPNSQYLYCSSTHNIYQFNVDTTNVIASLKTVAVNDNYYSPVPPLQTDFWLMYLAANGKIYLSSGNGVLDLHFIDFPDSSGQACSVQQHALHLPCWSARGNVNHPNYYLGPVIGGTCDSLPHVGIGELVGYDFHFSISPNPSDGGIKITYLLPQNQSGWFEVYEVNGRKVFRMPVSAWSTFQQITLPKLATGIYNAVISSGTRMEYKKLAVICK